MNLGNVAGIKRSCIRVMEVRNIQDHQNRWNLFSDRMSHHSMLKITTSHSQHRNHCWADQQVASLLTGFLKKNTRKNMQCTSQRGLQSLAYVPLGLSSEETQTLDQRESHKYTNDRQCSALCNMHQSIVNLTALADNLIKNTASALPINF